MAGRDRRRRPRSPSRNARQFAVALENGRDGRRTARRDQRRSPQPILSERFSGDGASGARWRHFSGAERRRRIGDAGVAGGGVKGRYKWPRWMGAISGVHEAIHQKNIAVIVAAPGTKTVRARL